MGGVQSDRAAARTAASAHHADDRWGSIDEMTRGTQPPAGQRNSSNPVHLHRLQLTTFARNNFGWRKGRVWEQLNGFRVNDRMLDLAASNGSTRLCTPARMRMHGGRALGMHTAWAKVN